MLLILKDSIQLSVKNSLLHLVSYFSFTSLKVLQKWGKTEAVRGRQELRLVEGEKRIHKYPGKEAGPKGRLANSSEMIQTLCAHTSVPDIIIASDYRQRCVICRLSPKMKVIFGQFQIASHCSVWRTRLGYEWGRRELVNFKALIRHSAELQKSWIWQSKQAGSACHCQVHCNTQVGFRQAPAARRPRSMCFSVSRQITAMLSQIIWNINHFASLCAPKRVSLLPVLLKHCIGILFVC